MTTTTLVPIRYGNLSSRARDIIRYWVGRPVTIAGYVRYWFADGIWRGDSCGCPDDRCIGFHHDDAADCHCLESTLSEYAVWAHGCPVCERLVDRDTAQPRVYDRNRLVLVAVHDGCADAARELLGARR